MPALPHEAGEGNPFFPGRLTDPTVLADVAQNNPSPLVRRAAETRLAELTGRKNN